MLSIEKAKTQLGWHPVWSTQVAIDECVSWYKQYFAGVAPSEVCLGQISRFEDDSSDLIEKF